MSKVNLPKITIQKNHIQSLYLIYIGIDMYLYLKFYNLEKYGHKFKKIAHLSYQR